MNVKNQILLCVLAFALICFTCEEACAWGHESAPSPDPSLPNVLLVGDSVLGGYDSYVRSMLAGEANVDFYGTPNYLKNGLAAGVRAIVDEHGPYDLVHFNDCGLHAWPVDRQPVDDAEYRTWLQEYVDHLEAAGTGTMIYAMTTCMTTEEDPSRVLDAVYNPVIINYNTQAAIVMADNGYPVTDLYAATTPHILSWKTDEYHWSGSGYQAMANVIVPAIRTALATPPPPPPATSVPGILAYYRFDTSYEDFSGNARHGTLTDTGVLGNSAIVTSEGDFVFGLGAMQFSNESDRISIPSLSLADDEAWTIAFWAQRDSTAQDWHTVLGKSGVNSDFLAIHGSEDVFLWKGSAPLQQDGVIFSENFDAYSNGDLEGQGSWVQLINTNDGFDVKAASGISGLHANFSGKVLNGGNGTDQFTKAFSRELSAGTTSIVMEWDVHTKGSENLFFGLWAGNERYFRTGPAGSSAQWIFRERNGTTATASETAGMNSTTAKSFHMRAVVDVVGETVDIFATNLTDGGSEVQIFDNQAMNLLAGESVMDIDGVYLRGAQNGGTMDNLEVSIVPIPSIPGNSDTQHTFTAAAGTDWHHYALVADGNGNLNFYFDGSLVSTAMEKNTAFTMDSMGDAYSSDTDFDLQGKIDELWVLDGAADADDVFALYNANTPPEPVTRVRVFLLGGQSNADGRADASDLPTSPVDLQQAQKDVNLYYRVEGMPNGLLTTLRPGLSETSEFGPEVSLGRSLADLYSEETGTRVAIIKYANGGTNLHTQWKAGGDASTTGDGSEYVIFQETVADGLAALATLFPAAAGDIQLEGMLWVQGESDTSDGNHTGYQANLTSFVSDVRATYGAELPFVISRLSSAQTALDSTGLAGVRAAQEAVAAADPRIGLIDTDTLGLQTDNLHFNALGSEQMGASLADEIIYLRWTLDTFDAAQIDAGDAGKDADPDGDGQKNRTEFVGLSNPLSNLGSDPDAFKSWITLPFEYTVIIHYPSSIYRTYSIEQYNVTTGAWVEILAPERGDGSIKEHTVTPDDQAQIFRVRSSLP